MLPVRILWAIVLVAMTSVAAADPLPSWNDTDARTRIISFVVDVSDPASDNFVPVADRIVVFDNDGTLWSEQPVYFQLIFTTDRLREMAAVDPSIITSDTARQRWTSAWPGTGRACTPDNAE